MARPKLPPEKRKQAVTVCVRPDLLTYARKQHINLSEILDRYLSALIESKAPCVPEALIDRCNPTGCGAPGEARES